MRSSNLCNTDATERNIVQIKNELLLTTVKQEPSQEIQDKSAHHHQKLYRCLHAVIKGSRDSCYQLSLKTLISAPKQTIQSIVHPEFTAHSFNHAGDAARPDRSP